MICRPIPDIWTEDHPSSSRGRHLSPTQIRRAGPSPEDRWPVCARAIRRRPKKGQKVGSLILDHKGEAQCYCRCKDETGRHRWDHADLAHDGKCFFCGKKL